MSDLVINREKLRLLDAIAGGRVTRQEGGAVVLRAGNRYQGRVDQKVRNLVNAGLVRYEPERMLYLLTDEGTAAAETARKGYEAQQFRPKV